MGEMDEAPGGYDHATPAQIGQDVPCGECGREVPAGDWVWLLSRGDVTAADEVKVLCQQCGEEAGCGPLDEIASGNGQGEL